MREFVPGTLNRISRYFDLEIRSDVVSYVTRNSQSVGTTVLVKGTQRQTIAENKDMSVAIDLAVDELDHQTLEHKEKPSTTVKKRTN